MAITKNVISNILDSMNYRELGAIDIIKDEFTENTVIMSTINNDVIIDNIYFIDTKENNIMFSIHRDTYHEEFNEENNETQYYEVAFNKAYFNDGRIINYIDDYFKRYTNNFDEVKDMNDRTYFDSILKFFWYNAETLYNDRYDFVTLTFKLLCNYMSDCQIEITFFDNNSMTYDI